MKPDLPVKAHSQNTTRAEEKPFNLSFTLTHTYFHIQPYISVVLINCFFVLYNKCCRLIVSQRIDIPNANKKLDFFCFYCDVAWPPFTSPTGLTLPVHSGNRQHFHH